MHTPAEHWPSAPDIEVWQLEPSGCVCTRQPAFGSQNESKQGPSSAGHCIGVPATQAEPTHFSAPLQTLPSSQTIGVPATQALFTQVSTPLHAWPSEHCASLPQAKPRHTPERQTSYLVAALPSLQAVSSGLGDVPAWHLWFTQLRGPAQTSLGAGQSASALHCATVPAQLPFDWHTSLKVMALPSLQVVPTSGAGSNLQPVAVQVSTVHGLLSLQPETRHCCSAATTSS